VAGGGQCASRPVGQKPGRAAVRQAREWWPGCSTGWRPGGQVDGGSMGVVATCSFSVLWHGEDFYGLGVQGAKVSALLGALPQQRMSPVSQQGPSVSELMQSVSVSQ
jgi:hypothetical protein